ncbi:hypothetical protein CAP47_11820 [Psychroflexus sp. S27]|uniref:HYC_CC_PP family protein n=1 Tax=Psychroflexus sp. S27 TaxID=1982757 RepID=UPI000C2A16EA|nr:hypothetical protein CAP47_11820 [Psychroflexus sp. S27]
MKFSNTYKTLATTLSFLMLFSTLSLTIEKHFCNDVLIDIAVFSDSENCGSDVYKQNKATKTDCCKDEIDIIEGLSEITINPNDDLDFVQQQVLIAYIYSYIHLFEDFQDELIPHQYYSPPILIEDIHVLNETYLI